MTTPARRRLPNRRPALTRTIDAGNHRLEVTICLDPADGQPREVFLDGAKGGGELAMILDDVATAMQDNEFDAKVIEQCDIVD